MKICSYVCGVVALFSLSACQSPYSQFYTRQLPASYERWLLPHVGETQFYSSPQNELQVGVENIIKRGYAVLGYSSFEANAGDYTGSLRAKSKELQADIVLVSSAYAGTQSGILPLVTYQPGQTATTYSSGQVNANAYGRGGAAYGTANYSGTSTTTTSGAFSTNYIPYSVSRNSYTAIYFRKYHFLIGARWRPLNDEERRALERNTGLVVNLVVDGTPAFAANILPGDMLVTFEGEPIQSTEWLNAQTIAKAGQLVKFGIVRGGREKTIELRLNSPLP